ncbi:MAG: acetylornithine/N-succinyldiaminopimelate aminotransferase [Chthoniobacter sp.]|jgi:acetylornithine/succinyldiaminopimelate/putrescine aminotransferase|nr:acetylornithine/N-succinyldiaminopimelate aminotransferase [Chthoniobacter sp.]
MDLTLHAANTRELFDQFVVPNYGRFPLQLARGKGCRVWDEAGREYLDFGAGIAVCSIGHCHPQIIAAMNAQLGTLVHTSNLYYTRPQGLLAKRLVELVGEPGKVFFCNSGAEANEALYKLARKFGNEGKPPPPIHTVGEEIASEQNRFGIITFDGSFHGRTLAGIAATGQEKVKRGFEPPVAGFSQVPFNDAPALLTAIRPDTTAVLLEPIQGEIGIRPATAHFLETVRSICDDHGLLLLFDEIQCGLGRTGDWCGWRSIAPDILPDAVSWAKGIAGGFPLGAVWIRDRQIALKTGVEISLANLLGPGSHGTTFGGTPLVCAGALAVLDTLESEGLLENARTLGLHAKTALANLGSPLIQEIRAVGLMIGIELTESFADHMKTGDRAPALWLVDRLHAAGLLTVPSGTHAIRWLPPLNVTRAEIDEAVDILRWVLVNHCP